MDSQSKQIFILDGATGTELDRRGVDIGLPLWSANAILEAPEILKQVHIAYLNAGADAIITNTFRTHERSLAKAGLGSRFEELTAKAVEIAQIARDEVNPNALVYGSVAPLEDCYSPNLAPDHLTCKKEHGQMIRHLVKAGVDLILIETMCSAHETIAAIEAVKEFGGAHWAVSFCFSTEQEGSLLDGTHISELLPAVEGAQFIGINCVPATMLSTQVTHLRELLPPEMPIAAYGNVGHRDNEGGWVITDAVDPNKFAHYAMEWVESGANIIGGCCGTTPKTIAAIRKTANH